MVIDSIDDGLESLIKTILDDVYNIPLNNITSSRPGARMENTFHPYDHAAHSLKNFLCTTSPKWMC